MYHEVNSLPDMFGYLYLHGSVACEPIMPIFVKNENNSWISQPRAMGPFKGLQGGGVAGLMVHELETLAAEEELGLAVSASVEFLRPTQAGVLDTEPEITRRGRRVSVLSNQILQDGEITARASVCFIQPMDMPAIEPPTAQPSNPLPLDVLPRKKVSHGQPWMMDNFEVRHAEDGVIWFRYVDALIEGVTPLARVLGPADWTHGIGRPASPRLADPNINLTVVLSRHPVGEFVGILPHTTWMPNGIGMGEGVLSDTQGAFGRVSMSVALTPFG